MTKIALFSIFSLLTAAVAFTQVPEEFTFKKNYGVKAPANMSISTNDGFVKAFARNSDEIQVYFIVKRNGKVQDMDMSELEEHMDVEISSSSSSLDISIKSRQRDWMRDWRERYYVSMYILAPEQTECNLRTSDGDIEMAGFYGAQNLRTSDGNIEAENIKGELYAKTSDGNIEALRIGGDIDLSTSDGDIYATDINGESYFKTSDGKIVATKIIGNLNAVTSDGNIMLEQIKGEHSARTSDGNIVFEELSGGLTAQTSDGDIRGNFDELNRKLYLKTSDGNISVTVPDGLGMDVKLKGEDINTRLESFSGNTSDHLVEGTIRGGGVDVELVTSDGDINLIYN